MGRLENVSKEWNSLRAQKTTKHNALKSKLSKVQHEESALANKYEQLKQEADKLKAIFDCLYGKLSLVNDDLMTQMNDLQKSNQQPKQRRKLMLKSSDDDTLKAAQILDGFSVDELESIMHCKKSNQRSQRKKRTNEKKSKYEKIVWN